MDGTPKSGPAGLPDRAYSRKEVIDIIRSVLGSMDKSKESEAKLHSELTTLANYIENMRSELAQLRSAEISKEHIPSASDELDAVVEETAKATGTIMDVCDKISTVAGSLPEPANGELTAGVTTIYEACTFQDITGQRINKVVKTLKHIEMKVAEIMGVFSERGVAPTVITQKDKDSLLNGPQLKGAASSQEDIDKLLASFG